MGSTKSINNAILKTLLLDFSSLCKVTMVSGMNSHPFTQNLLGGLSHTEVSHVKSRG